MLSFKPTFHSPLSLSSIGCLAPLGFYHKGSVICISEVTDISLIILIPACASLCDGLPVISSFFNSKLISFVLLYNTRPGPIKLSLPNGMISCFFIRRTVEEEGSSHTDSAVLLSSSSCIIQCVEHLVVIPSCELISSF